MEIVTAQSSRRPVMPEGVMSIEDGKQQKRANRTLAKAVSLHLEGKLETAARLLAKAIEGGENDASLLSALGHIQYELRDFEAAAATYTQMAEAEPQHRTAHFNLGVCQGNLQKWKPAAEAFRKALEADATRAEALLGLGIALIHAGSPAQALEPLEKYLSLFPDHEQALFSKAVALQQTGKHAEAVVLGGGGQAEGRPGQPELRSHVAGDEAQGHPVWRGGMEALRLMRHLLGGGRAIHPTHLDAGMFVDPGGLALGRGKGFGGDASIVIDQDLDSGVWIRDPGGKGCGKAQQEAGGQELVCWSRVHGETKNSLSGGDYPWRTGEARVKPRFRERPRCIRAIY